jgi:DNA-directed RNA polymerase specialized sigma24 family protein
VVASKKKQSGTADTCNPAYCYLERYRRDLHRYALRRLRSHADACDLVQDAYARYLSRPGADTPNNLGGFLFRIVSNLISDWCTQRSR